jgi:hypothetical protein
MVIISTLIGLPIAFSAQRFASVNSWIRLLTGVTSLAFGLFIMVEMGLVQELF